MLVKTFQASEMSEALRMVKAEMGLDAMILSSKKEKKKGVMGLFSKPYFEVTAAVEPRVTPRPAPYREPVREEPQRELSTKEEFQNSMLVPLAREVKELRSRIEALSKKEEQAQAQAAAPAPPALKGAITAAVEEKGYAKDELEEIKKLLMTAVAEKEKGAPKPVVFPQANAVPVKEEASPLSGPATRQQEQLSQLAAQQAKLAAERGKAQSELRVEFDAELAAAKRGMQQAEKLAAQQAELLVQKNDELAKELQAAINARQAAERIAREQAQLAAEKTELAERALASQEEALSAREEAQAAKERAAQQEAHAARLESELATAREAAAAAQRHAEEVAQRAAELQAQQEAELNAQLAVARKAIQQAELLSGELAQQQAEMVAAQAAKYSARGTGGHPVLEFLAEQLMSDEVNEESVAALMEHLRPAAQEGATLEELKALLQEAFGKTVQCAGSLRMNKECARVMAMVGPTGVGKTTTIAKLAAMHALSRGAKVALITTDNFRVGAIEQLKTYAKIMDLPLEVVVTSEELGRAIDKHADKDLILIDTAGRSQKDSDRLDELKGYLEAHTGVEIYLCVAATTRGKEIDDIVANFGVLPISKLLFTKIDESASFGTIINANRRHGLPLSWFTTGQKVPEDIEVATPRKLAQLIMKESA
ncbi:hypothetical protein LPW11_09435 [Geomonas sp. RF6]|uniref:hypothetical protein n=1 Tax=Geomonas sp. RF6 TaxID=2897342 RepID=UPI001E50C1AA|nr:hypothetical protein [Geomonas sp. RF6]UFS72399.1 hypothetical protein LPW11_09435 [Geomonas sp. RF6]